ncbi:MAG TPA: ATP-grasp domain-containing protein [Enteractinococcus sp.]
MTHNIFVLGLDALGVAELATLPDAHEYTFYGLMRLKELQSGTIDLKALLDKAQERLDSFDGSIDGIVGYWDFPISMMIPILCKRYGLPSKDLLATVKCEHKYWSRLEQQRLIDEYPKFGLVDMHDPAATLPEHMSYPVWAKPIKSFSSEGAYRVTSDEELQAVLAKRRASPERVGPAFDYILERLDLPEEIAGIPGNAYMVEEAAVGHQCTIEGYCHNNEVHLTGIVDSIPYDHVSSFLRYRYPSQLPLEAQERIRSVTRTVIAGLGLNHTTFNVEYFWDAETDDLNLLEVNTRHSQSHAPLFRYVDGLTNHAQMIDLALGREPRQPVDQGYFATASKWMHRRFTDGIVHRVPTPDEMAALEQRYPGTIIKLEVEEGQRLSDSFSQDSYSYMLFTIYTTGQSDEETIDLYNACIKSLKFDIEDV